MSTRKRRNKYSDRSVEVHLPALLGNEHRPTNRPTDRTGHREVTLQKVDLDNSCGEGLTPGADQGTDQLVFFGGQKGGTTVLLPHILPIIKFPEIYRKD